MFLAIRNDPRLNIYNRAIMTAWLANTDITPSIGIVVVKVYIAKYASKGEVETKSFLDFIKEVLPKIQGQAPLLSFVQRWMNKLVGERDWSA